MRGMKNNDSSDQEKNIDMDKDKDQEKNKDKDKDQEKNIDSMANSATEQTQVGLNEPVIAPRTEDSRR